MTISIYQRNGRLAVVINKESVETLLSANLHAMVPTEGLEPTPVEILSFLTLPIGLSGLNEKETVLFGY